MIDIDGLKAQVSDILHRFPSVTATVTRPAVDAYGQPTDSETSLGTVELWWKTPDTGKGFDLSERGLTYDEDDARWACLLNDSLPDVQRGDHVTIGSETYTIANRQTWMARVFWQLKLCEGV